MRMREGVQAGMRGGAHARRRMFVLIVMLLMQAYDVY